jgi:hypothetical protein
VVSPFTGFAPVVAVVAARNSTQYCTTRSESGSAVWPHPLPFPSFLHAWAVLPRPLSGGRERVAPIAVGTSVPCSDVLRRGAFPGP